MEVFRRMLLLRLHRVERLSERFMQNLMSWVHPGFSVYAGPPVEAAGIASLESQARYISRPALAMDALQKLDDGRLVLETPPDPRSGVISSRWMRSNGFTASCLISRIPDGTAKDSTAHTPTEPGFRFPRRMANAPARRRQNTPSRTIRISPGKRRARGLA